MEGQSPTFSERAEMTLGLDHLATLAALRHLAPGDPEVEVAIANAEATREFAVDAMGSYFAAADRVRELAAELTAKRMQGE